jgi:hypothetical protein
VKVTETILAVESDALTPESTILSEKKPERTGTYRGPTRESYRASTHLGQLCKFMFEGQLIKSRPGPSEQMIFLINFVNHSYQFEWRLNVRCSRCAEIYRKCKEDMLGFLRDFLCGHDISIALEEGGTCISIIEALRANGNEKTILEEVIATISEKHISHGFVDITENKVRNYLRTRLSLMSRS